MPPWKMPPLEQVVIGGTTAALCATGLWNADWILEHTKKGRRLVRVCGDGRATWLLRGLLTFGLVFGLLLATDVISPIQW